MRAVLLVVSVALLAACVQAVGSFTSFKGENIYFDPSRTTYDQACKGTGGRLAMVYAADLLPASNLATEVAWVGGWNGDDYNHATALAFTPNVKAISPFDPSSTFAALCVGETPSDNDEDADGFPDPDLRGYCAFSNRKCPAHWRHHNFLGLGFSRADITRNPFFTKGEHMPRPYDFDWVYPAAVCADKDENARPRITGLYSIARHCPRLSDEVGNVAVLIQSSSLGGFTVAEIGVEETSEPGWTWVYFKMCNYAKYSNKRFRSTGGCLLSHSSTCPAGFSYIGRAGLAQITETASDGFEKGSPIQGDIRNGLFVHPYLCCGSSKAVHPL